MVSRKVFSGRRAQDAHEPVHSGRFGSRADRGRRTRPRALKHAPIVAFASGKGGTGKSFLATTLALLAARRGLDPLVVDCDFGLADAHLLLGETPSTTWQSIADGRGDPEDVVTRTRHGVDLVAGGLGIEESSRIDHHGVGWLRDALGSWRQRRDLVLLDIGAGLTPTTAATMDLADHVVVITLPELAAMTDAYAVVKCITHRSPDKGRSLVVNRCTDDAIGARTWRKIDDVSRRFLGEGIQCLGRLAEAEGAGRQRLAEEPFALRAQGSETLRQADELLTALLGLFGTTEPTSADRIEEPRRSPSA